MFKFYSTFHRKSVSQKENNRIKQTRNYKNCPMHEKSKALLN